MSTWETKVVVLLWPIPVIYLSHCLWYHKAGGFPHLMLSLHLKNLYAYVLRHLQNLLWDDCTSKAEEIPTKTRSSTKNLSYTPIHKFSIMSSFDSEVLWTHEWIRHHQKYSLPSKTNKTIYIKTTKIDWKKKQHLKQITIFAANIVFMLFK